MASSTSSASQRGASSSVLRSVDHVADVVDSVKQYARQETLDPLRGAGRWLAFGLLATLCLGLSMVFGVLAVLRLVQDLGDSVFDASLSWIPYLVAFVVNALLVALAFSRINDSSLAKD